MITEPYDAVLTSAALAGLFCTLERVGLYAIEVIVAGILILLVCHNFRASRDAVRLQFPLIWSEELARWQAPLLQTKASEVLGIFQRSSDCLSFLRRGRARGGLQCVCETKEQSA